MTKKFKLPDLLVHYPNEDGTVDVEPRTQVLEINTLGFTNSIELSQKNAQYLTMDIVVPQLGDVHNIIEIGLRNSTINNQLLDDLRQLLEVTCQTLLDESPNALLDFLHSLQHLNFNPQVFLYDTQGLIRTEILAIQTLERESERTPNFFKEFQMHINKIKGLQNMSIDSKNMHAFLNLFESITPALVDHIKASYDFDKLFPKPTIADKYTTKYYTDGIKNTADRLKMFFQIMKANAPRNTFDLSNMHALMMKNIQRTSCQSDELVNRFIEYLTTHENEFMHLFKNAWTNPQHRYILMTTDKKEPYFQYVAFLERLFMETSSYIEDQSNVLTPLDTPHQNALKYRFM